MATHNKKHLTAWKDPNTDILYDLRHLIPFNTQFKIKLSKVEESIIPCRVSFSNHCYTKTFRHYTTDSKPEPDANIDKLILFTEEKKGGSLIEERVFCPKRWEFSKKAPDIIRDLETKQCFKGNSHSVIYRLEPKDIHSNVEGWYICMKLKYNKNVTPPSLDIMISSIHWRENRPDGIRGRGRFYTILMDLIKNKEQQDNKKPH